MKRFMIFTMMVLMTSCNVIKKKQTDLPMPNYVAKGRSFIINGISDDIPFQLNRYNDCLWIMIKDPVESFDRIIRYRNRIIKNSDEIYIYQFQMRMISVTYGEKSVIIQGEDLHMEFFWVSVTYVDNDGKEKKIIKYK